jgi:hypothetical protein
LFGLNHPELAELHAQQLGEGCLFPWIEHLKDVLTPEAEVPQADMEEDDIGSDVLIAADSVSTYGSERQPAGQQDPEELGLEVWHGEPFTDRKSTFQAHVAKIRTEADAMRVLAWLKLDRKIARATHNMWAFRVLDEGRGAQVSRPLSDLEQ